jgi:hypothetical protein
MTEKVLFDPVESFIRYSSLYDEPVQVIYNALFTGGNGIFWSEEGELVQHEFWLRDKEPAKDGYMKLYDEYHKGLSQFRETQRDYIKASLLGFSNQHLLRCVNNASKYCNFIEHDHIENINDHWYNVLSRVREHLGMLINNHLNRSYHPNQVANAIEIASLFDETPTGKKVKQDAIRFEQFVKKIGV